MAWLMEIMVEMMCMMKGVLPVLFVNGLAFYFLLPIKALRWMRLGLERTKNNYIYKHISYKKTNDLNDLGWTPNH